MSEQETDSDWFSIIDERARKLSKAVELRFNNRLVGAVNKVIGDEELTQDEVIERTGAALNAFFDTMVGTTVGLVFKHANGSLEMEERVVANVHRWFQAIRAMEEKNGNH